MKVELYQIGIAMALCFSAMGSALGCGSAAMAAAGAWKKCFKEGKAAPFILSAFVGAPLTQIIYGFLLTIFINQGIARGASPLLAFGVGCLGGLTIGMSAFFQGKTGACACDALGEANKGTANYFIIVGIIETVALFTLVFGMLILR